MTDAHITDTAPAPGPASTQAADATPSRRDRILESAARAFATHGYRGSSLRDIAREAGCSLTLLDHHFGGKGQLLDAVLQQQHRNCEKRLDGLRASIESTPRIHLEDFVERWANYEFDLYTTPQGRLYLQLMMRLSMESEVEAQRRRDLDCAQVLVLKAFERARPALDDDAREAGWFLASAALYAAIVRADEGTPPEGVTTSTPERRRTVAFLVEGLKGCWNERPGAPAA
ncbi:MAG: TetR/AcrR family transcriptional regulator [Burkholderiales bacterium]|nr:TetR/AcrR family transcriptional regulator [Burkholderiales bacterium]